MTNVDKTENGVEKNGGLPKKDDITPVPDKRCMTTRDKIIYTMIHNYIHLLFVSIFE